MLTGLTTPGTKTSEFLLTVVNLIVQLVLALTDVLSNGTATKLGLAGTIAYVISRGLAKYEVRGTTPPPPPQPPVA